MRRVLVQYTVAEDQVATNEELVRAVYAELAATAPAGIRYGTFKLDDGVTFIHLAVVDADENPLGKVEAFARFQEGIRDRCVEQPVVTELEEIGSYRLTGPGA